MSMVDKRSRRAPSLPVVPVLAVLVVLVLLGASLRAGAAPYAAMVMDARTGEVLHSRNADTRLHPASLTKMMTLYIAFEAVQNGEIGLDDKILISKKAASEVPSKLGLRAGSRIELRYLIRAAAIKSANDAATAIAEGIEGSEAAFARRMTRTAKALGMTRTTFKNAHGLTEEGHLSTARDMTIMGRRLFFDYPQYYNIFSRTSTNAKLATVHNTNRRFLGAYKGADGIKTGYTRAAGFNLVASAERGSERIITTVFGGNSTASRNAEVARLMDIGFQRAPRYAKVRKPAPPNYAAVDGPARAGKVVRVVRAVHSSIRPRPRPAAPTAEPAPELLLAMQSEIEAAVASAADAATAGTTDTAAAPPQEQALADATAAAATTPEPRPTTRIAQGAAAPQRSGLAANAVAAAEAIVPRAVSFLRTSPAPEPRPNATADLAAAPPSATEIVARASSSGGRYWAISIGSYPSRFHAEKALLTTALTELRTLDGALRRVSRQSGGFEAHFVGLSEDQAALACRRLVARGTTCETQAPG